MKLLQRILALVAVGVFSVLLVQTGIRRLYQRYRGRYYEHSTWVADDNEPFGGSR